MSLLEVRKVSMFFGGLAAISDVSFEVKKGEILGLIGPNGAGKTTMFNVVNGFYKPSKGEVSFKDKKISGLKPHEICKMGVARTFQVVKPLQRMSVLDNVIASAFLRVKSRAQAEETALETIRFTGLYDDRDVISSGKRVPGSRTVHPTYRHQHLPEASGTLHSPLQRGDTPVPLPGECASGALAR